MVAGAQSTSCSQLARARNLECIVKGCDGRVVLLSPSDSPASEHVCQTRDKQSQEVIASVRPASYGARSRIEERLQLLGGPRRWVLYMIS